MRTDLLEEEQGLRPYCWEFHCRPGEEISACDNCLVRRSGAEYCYELRKVIPSFMKRVDIPDRGGAWSDYFRDSAAGVARGVELGSGFLGGGLLLG